MKKIPQSVVEKLGWYVYAYVDRRSRRVRYVGKGKGQRLLAHLWRMPHHRIDVVAHGLRDEATALAVECALIDALGLDKLVNQVPGKGARRAGRAPLVDLVFRYSARRVSFTEPTVLIRVNRLYRPGISARELYESTRGVWVAGPRREQVQYACAVYRGIVREVYRIRKWLRGGTSSYRFRHPERHWASRWEFTGTLAEPAIRRKYIGGSVAHLLPDGAQNPIRYVGPTSAA